MRKIISAFLFCAIAFSSFISFGVFASATVEYEPVMNPDYVYTAEVEAVYDTLFDFSKYTEETGTTDVDYDYIVRIDISEFNMTTEEAFACYRSMFHQYPELFFLDGWMGASHYIGSDVAVAMVFRTAYHIDDIPQMLEEFEAAAAPIIEGGLELQTPAEKALYVHNYIILNTKYNEDVINGQAYSEVVFTAYGVLVNRDAVCQGYAYAFNYIMKRLGVISEYVISDEMNHGWNIVNIGDYWYHLDATWDDPVYDLVGKIYYNNFLRSEAGIIEVEHSGMLDYNTVNGTSTVYDLSDTTYDDLFLHNSNTYRGNSAYYDGKWYFAVMNYDNQVYIASTDNIFVTESELEYTLVKECAYALDYPGFYIYDDKFYYTKATGIYSCNIDGSDDKVIYEPALESGQKVFGITVRDGYAYYNIETGRSGFTAHPTIYSYALPAPLPPLTPSQSATFSYDDTMIWNIPYGTTAGEIASMFDGECLITDFSGEEIDRSEVLGTGYQVHNLDSTSILKIVILNDLNGDALINGKDLIRMKKYILGMEDDVTYLRCGDINGDGSVTDADIELLISAIDN